MTLQEEAKANIEAKKKAKAISILEGMILDEAEYRRRADEIKKMIDNFDPEKIGDYRG